MEGIQRGLSQHWGKAIVALIVLAIIVAYTSTVSYTHLTLPTKRIV